MDLRGLLPGGVEAQIADRRGKCRNNNLVEFTSVVVRSRGFGLWSAFTIFDVVFFCWEQGDGFMSYSNFMERVWFGGEGGKVLEGSRSYKIIQMVCLLG